MENALANEFLKTIRKQAEKYKELGDKTIQRLNEEELHRHTNEESNSVAIIMKHMSGNMISRSTDFLTTDGEKPNRVRDSEFEDYNESKTELVAQWEKGWKVFLDTLNSLKEDDLMKTVTISQNPNSVVKALMVQMSHYTYHIGQMIYMAKQIKGADWETLSIPKKKKL